MPKILILTRSNRLSMDKIEIEVLWRKIPALIELIKFQYCQVFDGMNDNNIHTIKYLAMIKCSI